MFSVHSDPDSLNITSSVDITNQSRASYSLDALGLHHQDALFSSVDDGNISVGDLLAKLSANTSQFTSLADLIRVLREAKIYGPVGLLDDNEEIAMSGGHHLRKFLGLGSQFIVYRQQMEVVTGQMVSSRVVAVKQPKFRLDAQQRLNLTNAKVREQLHDMYLEVLAFSNPTLRSHPNIARLLAWSVDPRSWHTPPLLIMEVAFSDLKTFLQGEGPDALWELKYFICLDIASALDVIHEFRLFHGDLKPRNVLIYPTHSRFIAKLADFGLSVDEALFLRTDTCVAGTPGWQAPEVESHQCIQLDDLPYVDSYSYGLLVWSVFCHTGNCPPQSGAVDRQDTARKELGVLQDALDPAKRLNLDLPRVIGSLLEYKACNRPTQMVKILDDGSEIPNEWHIYHPQADYLSWESPAIPSFFAKAMYIRFAENLESLAGDLLFNMFLSFTVSALSDPTLKIPVLNILVAAALADFEPAKAILPRVYAFFEKELPSEIDNRIVEWLASAVSTGSTIAISELKVRGCATPSESVQLFRKLGGYNQFYSMIDRSPHPRAEPGGQRRTGGPMRSYSRLHWYATYGNFEEMMHFLDTHEIDHIDSMSHDNETPLYLACARSDWKIASELLNLGADPAVSCTAFGLTCLHWVFGFDSDVLTIAIKELVARGADLNAVASEETPFFHYPFTLPAGTPLHWAVATSSHDAVQAFVELGADLLIRSGSDLYAYNDGVRPNDQFGDLSFAIHSPEGGPMLRLISWSY